VYLAIGTVPAVGTSGLAGKLGPGGGSLRGSYSGLLGLPAALVLGGLLVTCHHSLASLLSNRGLLKVTNRPGLADLARLRNGGGWHTRRLTRTRSRKAPGQGTIYLSAHWCAHWPHP
jgi:hypothetical protein